MKRNNRLFLIGLTALLLSTGLVLAGCDTGGDDGGNPPGGGGGSGTKTITIKNETTGDHPVNITGVAVYDDNAKLFLIGEGEGDNFFPSTYDTTKTASAGETIASFTVTLTESKYGTYNGLVYVKNETDDDNYDTVRTIGDEGSPEAYTLVYKYDKSVPKEGGGYRYEYKLEVE